jgi:hypothetical protein
MIIIVDHREVLGHAGVLMIGTYGHSFLGQMG